MPERLNSVLAIPGMTFLFSLNCNRSRSQLLDYRLEHEEGAMENAAQPPAVPCSSLDVHSLSEAKTPCFNVIRSALSMLWGRPGEWPCVANARQIEGSKLRFLTLITSVNLAALLACLVVGPSCR
jgi:hypothetical protein